MILGLLLAAGMLSDPTLQGFVREAGSEEPIAYATVAIGELGRSAITDSLLIVCPPVVTRGRSATPLASWPSRPGRQLVRR